MKLKTLNLTVLLVTILVLTPTIQMVLAQTPSTAWISSGIQQPYSYVIWKEGSYYYAKNAYGKIDYSGTNASQIIQNAINALGSKGGSIKGEGITTEPIVITNSITLSDYITISDFHFQLADGANCHLFITDGTTISTGINIKYIRIDGNRPNQAITQLKAISIYRPARCRIENVWIIAWYGIGIKFYGEGTYYANYITDNIIETCDDGTTNGHGIFIDGTITDNSILANNVGWCSGAGIYVTTAGNKIDENHVWGSRFGIHVAENGNKINNNRCEKNDNHGLLIEANETVVTGGSFENNNSDKGTTGSGIRIYNSLDTLIVGIHAYDGQDSPTQQYGISESGSTDYTLIVGCDCRLGNIAKGILILGTNSHVNHSWNGTTWIS